MNRLTFTMAAATIITVSSMAFAGTAVVNEQGQVEMVPVEESMSTTVGGGAPEANASVSCNILLGVKVARAATEELQKVKLAIPVKQDFTLDMYFPADVLDEQALMIGGNISSVHMCDTPLGDMIRYVVAFNGDGEANAFLPKIGPEDDGFQLLLVDGDSNFHSVAYLGQESVMFN